MSEDPQPVELEQVWVGAEDLPVHFANAFTGVVGPNAIFLVLGSQLPPAVSSEEEFERLKEQGFLPIKPIARLALTPQGLDDLIGILENTRENFQQLGKEIGK